MHIEPAVDGVMLDEARDALALVGVVPLMGNEDTGLHGGHDRGGNLLEETVKRLLARGFELMRVRGQVGEAPDQFLPRPRIFDRPVESIGKIPRLNLAPVESDHVSCPRWGFPRLSDGPCRRRASRSAGAPSYPQDRSRRSRLARSPRR